MKFVVDAVFSTQQYQMAKRLLDAAALRHSALASNIANVATPGYKRIDLAPDFQAHLHEALQSGDQQAFVKLVPTVAEDMTAAAVRPDGNNVSMDKELMEVNRNSQEYQSLTQYLSSNLQQIRAAISSQTNG